MDRCPLEIYLSIFSLACTDEGHTGRSLALVSKAFADASRPVQLQSIALRGPSQICGFAAMLKKRNDCDRRVRNLFVSLMTHTRREVDPTRREQDLGYPPSEKEYFQATESILSLTSPHLSILFFWWKGRTSMQLMTCLAQMDLQRLTELSVDSSSHLPNALTGDFLRAPNLKRLHLSFARDLTIPSGFPSLLSRSCPHLSHLYLAHVLFWKLPRDFVEAISDRMSRASPSEKGEDPFPPRLNSLTLDRIVPRLRGNSVPVEILSGEALEIETKMSELANCNSGFLWVNRVVSNHSRTYKAPQWWHKRITSGEGCWIGRF